MSKYDLAHNTDDPHGVNDRLGAMLKRATLPIDGALYDNAEVRRRLARRASRRTAIRGLGLVGVLAAGAVGVWQVTTNDAETIRVVDSPATSAPPTDTVTPSTDTAPPDRSTTDQSATSVAGQATPPPSPEAIKPMVVIPEPPLDPREGAATAGNEAGLLVWGGETPYDGGADEPQPTLFSDGAWYDMATSTWRVVPPAPMPAGFARAVAVDDTIVVLANGSFAAYLPASDSWAEVPAPPRPVVPESALFVVDGQVIEMPAAQIFDPSTGTWRVVEPPVAAGSSVFAGSDAGLFMVTLNGSSASFARLDLPSGSWKPLENAPIQAAGALLGIVAGPERAIVTTWSGMQAAALDTATGEWATLPPIPTFDSKCQFRGVPVGLSFVIDGCGRWLLDPDGRWHPLFADATDFAYRPPTSLALISLRPDAAVVDGRLLTADPNTGDVLGDLGPGRLAGATIDSSAVVESARREGATLRIDLVDGCSMSARSTDASPKPLADDGQQTMAAALAAIPVFGPPMTFHNPWFGSAYELTCPDSTSYRGIAEQIDIAGEAVGRVDVTSLFTGDRFNAAQPDQGLDRVMAILEPIGRSFDSPMIITGLGGWQPPTDGRTFATIDLGVIAEVRGGPIDGLLVELSLVDDGNGTLRVETATQWTRCTRGADLDDPTTCRGAGPT